MAAILAFVVAFVLFAYFLTRDTVGDAQDEAAENIDQYTSRQLQTRDINSLGYYATTEDEGFYRIPIGVAMEEIVERYPAGPGKVEAPAHFNTYDVRRIGFSEGLMLDERQTVDPAPIDPIESYTTTPPPTRTPALIAPERAEPGIATPEAAPPVTDPLYTN